MSYFPVVSCRLAPLRKRVKQGDNLRRVGGKGVGGWLEANAVTAKEVSETSDTVRGTSVLVGTERRRSVAGLRFHTSR